MEQKFLIAEPRGATLSNYKEVPWVDKVLLLVDDFEGFTSDSLVSKKENFFTFGSIKLSIDHSQIDSTPVSKHSSLEVKWTGKDNYGGWGKGVGANIDLDSLTDFLNFRIFLPKKEINEDKIKIVLEEDDNNDGILQKDKDDAWYYILNVAAENKWQMISIPLKDFKDDNEGGDHKFNINRKSGLHTIIFSFQNTDKYTADQKWYFDFICFTSEKITCL